MKSLIAIMAIGISLVATSASAQAPWVEDATKSMRIGFKPDFADAAAFKPVVTVRRDGSQRDSLMLGSMSLPGPVAWITYQSAPLGITYGGNTVDVVTTLLLRGASLSREQRKRYSVSTLYGSVEVIQAAATLGDQSKRECAVWLENADGVSRMFWGYYCGGIDQALDEAAVLAAVGAVVHR